METIEKVQTDLKAILSERRYNHSIGAMRYAIKLAKIYDIDSNVAGLTALAHDIAKELPEEERLKYVEENNIEIDEVERKNTGLLHAKIGADMSKRYEFTQEMQNAIKYHTTAHTDMTLLEKIVFVADKIEENRTYEGVEDLRKLAEKDLDKCIITILDMVIKKNEKKGLEIHQDTISAREQLTHNSTK